MAKSSIADRIKNYQKRAKESNSGSSNYNDDENIFFDFTEGTHRIRLVGQWTTVHSHWIGPSQFSKISFYDESSFKGDNRLKKNINCSNWDPDTETPTEESTCTICKLRSVANDLLYECSDLDSKQKKYLENIASEAFPNERTFFLCIDRDNPEIAPGKKGFKIIEFPRALMKNWITLVEQNADFDPTSEEEGVDFIVTKEKKGKKTEYNINYAMKGLNVCQTPLTDEEKEYTKHDIKKIMGKLPDQDDLFDKLLPEFQELINDGSEGDDFAEEPEEPKKPASKRPTPPVQEEEPEEPALESGDDDDDDVPF